MPVLRTGTFVLYGVTLANPDTLTDGATLSPPDPANWYLVNTGPATPIPCVPQWSPPSLLDTTTEGTGFSAGAPPPGFFPHFGLGSSPIAHSGFSNTLLTDLNGLNVGNFWSMAGSGHVNVAGPTESKEIYNGPGLDTYVELLEFLELHVVDLHTVFFPHAIWPISGGISTPTVGPRVVGSYDIVAWWWIIRDKDECGIRHISRLRLDVEQPSSSPSEGTWEKLDPDDIDAAPTPIIEEIVPNYGPTAGGTEITIRGSGFGEDCTVDIDGTPCTGVVYVSQYEVRATVPAHAAGLETVVLTNADGVST